MMDAHAIKHVNHIFRSYIAAGSPGVRTPAQPGYGGINNTDSCLKRNQNIGQCLPVSIMKMNGQPLDWNISSDCINQFPGGNRCPNSYSVPQGNFITPDIFQAVGDFQDLFGGYGAGIGTSPLHRKCIHAP